MKKIIIFSLITTCSLQCILSLDHCRSCEGPINETVLSNGSSLDPRDGSINVAALSNGGRCTYQSSRYHNMPEYDCEHALDGVHKNGELASILLI